jgi:hypothetical protein
MSDERLRDLAEAAVGYAAFFWFIILLSAIDQLRPICQ